MSGHFPSHFFFLLISRLIASLRLGDESVAEEGNLFSFVSHERKRKAKGGGDPYKWCVGKLRRGRARRAA